MVKSIPQQLFRLRKTIVRNVGDCVDLRPVWSLWKKEIVSCTCHWTEMCSSQLLRKSCDGHFATKAELYQ